MKDVLKVIVFGAIFAVPFLTLYVENDYFFPFITGKNFGFRILIDIAFAAWVLLALYEPKYRPKWSWLLGGFGVLLVIMFFANLFGAHPSSSFWSNFERMDGYVSLFHTFVYFVILGSVIQTKELWRRFLYTSLTVASIVAFVGINQYLGNDRIPALFNASSSASIDRIDSTLGNAAYMAIYMLFHIFIAFWLFVEAKKKWAKAVLAFLALVFIFVLIETGTRGTAVGLAAGVFVMSGYIAIFGNQFKEFRKYAIGIFILLILGVGGFIAGKDSEFVQSNPNFARIANISLNDLAIRATIWGGALEGVKEQPILGYGQSNFNFVFNEQYNPALYAQEQWFDRAHNIFIDWLITGGVLGLAGYLSIFLAFAWCLLIRPIVRKEDTSFSVLERGVLLGILAGYFTHNLVVFDNIVSYMFFAIILGLVHSRVGKPIKKLEAFKVDQSIIVQFATPVVVVLLGVGMYFAHLPGMLAAADIIKSFNEQDPIERLEHYKTAIDRGSFAYQEIVEQLAQQTIGIVRAESVSAEVKSLYIQYTEEQINSLIAWKPNDARIHVFAGTYYRSINQLDKAAEQMAIARSLSPLKQSIIIQQAFVELTRGNNDNAIEFFKVAFELDENNMQAREFYAGALIAVDRTEEAVALMDSEAAKNRFAQSDFIVSYANQKGMTNFLVELFERRVELEPDVVQHRATLAFLYHTQGNKDAALEILETSAAQFPEFASLASCVADNIENDREPTEGCE